MSMVGTEIFEKCLKIFIAGPVGVGKTTFINNIQKQIPEGSRIHIIPEYVDGDPEGPEILKKFLNKEMNNFQFQMYILEFYEKYIISILPEVHEEDIIVFERLPDEGVVCFANITYHEQGLTKNDMRELINKVLELDVRFGLPSLLNLKLHNFSFNTMKTVNPESSAAVAKSTIDLAKLLNQHIVIGLYNTPEVCYKRILQRARDGEGVYSYSNVERFTRIYANIYRNVLASKDITVDSLPSIFIRCE